MKKAWNLHDAKNRFSEVVDRALHEGPQVVSRRGRDAVVVVSCDAYRAWTNQSGVNLADFFRQSPLAGENIDLTRDSDTGRIIDL